MALYTVSITDGTTLANLAVSAGRGPKGDGWTGVTYDNGTGRFTFTSTDGLGYVSGSITGDLDTAVTEAEAAQAAAEAAQAATESIFDQFGDQYLGPKASDPTVDNDGDPLTEGDIYFNTTDDVLKFYSGTAWVAPESIATTAANEAEASATAAATSETNAASSASAASTSETNAASSASAASTSETNAATSETNAASSASAASTSETNAAASETAAAASETAAAASETAAATSESNAASSASAASTSASNAATSETNAASSASAASTSETNAATSASNASTSETNAASSAAAAATSASEAAASAASIDPDNIDINGGTIDGAVIGGSVPAAGSFTTGSFTGDVAHGDGVKATFGASADLQVFHDNINSIIRDVGTGDLQISASNNITFYNDDFSKVYANFTDTSSTLNHDGSLRLATSSSGINVTGSIFADDELKIESSTGYGKIEVGGPSGAFIDLKSPFSDDYDGRIITTGSGLAITGGPSTGVALQYSGSSKVSTTATGIDVTGEITADGLTVEGTDAASVNTDFIYRPSGDNINNYQIVGLYNASGSTSGAFPNLSAGFSFDVNGGYGVSGGFVLNTDENGGPLIFGTNNTERMTIDSSGNMTMTGGGSVGWANFTFKEESGYLYVYNGSTKIMRVDASGNAAFAGDVEANATL